MRYRVRFRCNQSGPTATLLQARIWPEAGIEPGFWHVEFLDESSPVLQEIYGDLALDSWSSINPNTPGSPTPQHTHIDDVEVVRLCNPLGAATAFEAVDFGQIVADHAVPGRALAAKQPAVDARGNRFVVTEAGSVAAVSAAGVSWGTITLPRAAQGVLLGGIGGRTLWVLTGVGAYRVPVSFPAASGQSTP